MEMKIQFHKSLLVSFLIFFSSFLFFFFTQEQYEQLMRQLHKCIGVQMTDDRQRDEYTHCTWAGGTFFPVVPLCQFFSYGGKQFQVLLTYHTSCAVMSFFGCGAKQFLIAQVSFLVVAGNSFRCYLLTYHTSCAIVSVFWLRREIVIGSTVYKKDSYLLSSIERESASRCVYFVRSNTLLQCNSLLCIYLLGTVHIQRLTDQRLFL